MQKIDLNNEKTKDFIAGLIALVFVVAAGYLAFNRFNNPDGSILDLGIGGRREEAMDEKENSMESVAGDNSSQTWQATDYKEGDISAGNYTVKSGDTLWEIAEAVYGNGAQWTEILNANASDIGYLPDGTQALIVPGQVLRLP